TEPPRPGTGAARIGRGVLALVRPRDAAGARRSQAAHRMPRRARTPGGRACGGREAPPGARRRPAPPPLAAALHLRAGLERSSAAAFIFRRPRARVAIALPHRQRGVSGEPRIPEGQVAADEHGAAGRGDLLRVTARLAETARDHACRTRLVTCGSTMS